MDDNWEEIEKRAESIARDQYGVAFCELPSITQVVVIHKAEDWYTQDKQAEADYRRELGI